MITDRLPGLDPTKLFSNSSGNPTGGRYKKKKKFTNKKKNSTRSLW